MKSFKNFLVLAVCLMAGVCGCLAQGKMEPVFEEGSTAVKNAVGDLAYTDFFQMRQNVETGEEWFVVVCDKPARELWQKCRMWAAETCGAYSSAKLIEDKEANLLMFKMSFPIQTEGEHKGYYSRWTGSHNWKVVIECKEGRLRIKFKDYFAKWSVQAKSPNGNGWMKPIPEQSFNFTKAQEMMGEDRFVPLFTSAVTGLEGSLVKYLCGAFAEEDF